MDWVCNKDKFKTEYACDECRIMVGVFDIIFCECGNILCRDCKTRSHHVKHQVLEVDLNGQCNF